MIDPGRDGRGARDGVRVAVQRAELARARRVLRRGLARALRRTLARQARRRCRATPTPGRWTAAVATSPSPLRPTARCWPATRSRSSPAWRCWRCSSCAARAAPAPRWRRLPDAPARAWPLRRALAGGRGRGARARLRLRPARRRGPRPAGLLAPWRGVSAPSLALLAGASCSSSCPSCTWRGLPDEGYDTNYAVQRIAAHWPLWRRVRARRRSVLTLSPALARRRGPDS